MRRATARPAGFALFAGAALSGATGPPAQDIYRWVDADGVVHFTDQPPPVGDTATWRPPGRSDG